VSVSETETEEERGGAGDLGSLGSLKGGPPGAFAASPDGETESACGQRRGDGKRRAPHCASGPQTTNRRGLGSDRGTGDLHYGFIMSVNEIRPERGLRRGGGGDLQDLGGGLGGEEGPQALVLREHPPVPQRTQGATQRSSHTISHGFQTSETNFPRTQPYKILKKFLRTQA